MQDIFWKNELTNQNKHIYFGSNHFFLTHNFQKYGIDDLTKFKLEKTNSSVGIFLYNQLKGQKNKAYKIQMQTSLTTV
jgi:hypothetical protein